MDLKIQVLHVHGEWRTVCLTNDDFLSDMISALTHKFKGRQFQILSVDDEVLYDEIYG